MAIDIKKNRLVQQPEYLDDTLFQKPIANTKDKGLAGKTENKLYYRLIHDDIWPTTAQPFSNGPDHISCTLPEEDGMNVPIWTQIKEPIERLLKMMSKVIAFEEDAIFKSKDWPYAWPRKK